MKTDVPLAVSLLAVGMLLLAGCTATPPAPEPSEAPGVTLPQPAPPLPLDQVARYGAVAMLSAGSNCTGTLIDTGVADGPAYVLTNGHCTDGVGQSAQKTTLNEDWHGFAEFFRAKGNLGDTLKVDVTELAYSTMRDTDTAIVRLKPTLGALEKLGVTPLRITDAQPTPGAHVVNVGVPVQNLTDDDWVLRKGSCTLGTRHTLIEFGWLWHDVWNTDCPGILQGSSGSPLLQTDASGPTEIVAMINTTTSGANPADGGACWLNRPCQLTANMVRMKPDTAYAQSVAGIDRCFSQTTGVFSAGGSCPLPVSDVWAEESGGTFRGGNEPDAAGRAPTVRLVGRQAGTVRTALVPLGDGTACADPATYRGAASHPLPVAEEHSWDPSVGLTLPVTLPEEQGRYLLCAVRGDAYAASAGVLFTVDRTPPVLPADATVERHDGGVTVQPHFNPPALASVRFIWGPKGRVDCKDTAAFQDFFMVPLTLTRDELPATYCIYGMDVAGNRTPVTKIDIPR